MNLWGGSDREWHSPSLLRLLLLWILFSGYLPFISWCHQWLRSIGPRQKFSSGHFYSQSTVFKIFILRHPVGHHLLSNVTDAHSYMYALHSITDFLGLFTFQTWHRFVGNPVPPKEAYTATGTSCGLCSSIWVTSSAYRCSITSEQTSDCPSVEK